MVGSDKRLALVAKDMVSHFEDRVAALDGKAMVVCMSRRICAKLYDEIVKLRPDWHSADDNAGAIKIVMTGAASECLQNGNSTSAIRPDVTCWQNVLATERPAQAGDR